MTPCSIDHVLFGMTEHAERNVSVKQLVWGSIHIAPEKFKNAALFLRLGLPSTKWRNLKKSAFRLRVDGKHFENKA